jgi:hypothetical protein
MRSSAEAAGNKPAPPLAWPLASKHAGKETPQRRVLPCGVSSNVPVFSGERTPHGSGGAVVLQRFLISHQKRGLSVDSGLIDPSFTAIPRAALGMAMPIVDSVGSPWPTIITLAVGFSRSGSAWLGRSQMACRPAVRGRLQTRQGHRLALEGQPSRAPFEWGAGMDAKAVDLALLAAIAVLCAMLAWAGNRDVVGSLFFALGAVAILSAGYAQQR